ncbi:MAG: gliding motility-associated C-terminal domain-containing protein [Bacteroides sp.]|nr:gliding motility-associated C-terminal domain-containing protein [Bacteroides sp.]MCM1379015.1 gliding motility-associated C-terminal domain-containing protein [Bacteroides sp.]MCM1445631.1 gliding motility-associated C-terminal domain-containing protein [Prevotella sp.]
MPSLKLTLLLATLPLLSQATELTFSGNVLLALTETPAIGTGLNQIYVLNGVRGVKASFASSNGATVTWQRYNALGGGTAEEVPSTQTGNVSTLTTLEGNMGYIVTDGNTSNFFWVVDWSSTPTYLAELELSPQSDCSTTWLTLDGQGDAIVYYSINGAPYTIDREFELTYRTLEFDEEDFAYKETVVTETYASLSEQLHCTPSLCQTDFTLEGDKFARAWGEDRVITSSVYEPTAVEGHARAIQTSRDVPNEITDANGNLGGSGPAEITFSAAISDAAIYHEWEIARDPQFEQTYLRFQDIEFSYTFREQGTTYVRLLLANDNASCQWESETYQVFIGESSLKCPNAFSPGASEGVNDEWRVSYKSIIEFDCHIFDRNGKEIKHLTDPSQGWNGMIRGKLAPSGVYFYVIRAEGADGKKYKLSGDINIIGYNNAKK